MIDDGFEIKFLPGIPPQDAGCPPLSPRTERVDGMIIEYDTAVRMRDGIEIYADVFRPDSPSWCRRSSAGAHTASTAR